MWIGAHPLTMALFTKLIEDEAKQSNTKFCKPSPASLPCQVYLFLGKYFIFLLNSDDKIFCTSTDKLNLKYIIVYGLSGSGMNACQKIGINETGGKKFDGKWQKLDIRDISVKKICSGKK